MQLTDIPITDILAMKITDSDTDIFQFTTWNILSV